MPELTADNLALFVEKYEEAKKDERELFTFEGDMILVDFAEYIIEYLSLSVENAVKAILN